MNQEWIEREYSKKHINDAVLLELRSEPEINTLIEKGISALYNWLDTPAHYESKQMRKDILKYMNGIHIVEQVYIQVVREQETTLTNIVMALVHLTGLWKRTAILAMAEIVAVLCEADFFDIYKQGTVWMVKSRVTLSKELQDRIDQSCYLPPLVEKPRTITSNFDTPYYTYEGESLILGGKHNHHEGDICLDVINIQNQIPLSLDMRFMASYVQAKPDFSDVGTGLPEPEEKRQKALAERQWVRMETQTQYFSLLLHQITNKIWMGNRVDKRGRMYTSGYSLSVQGNSYRKACVDLFHKEFIDVPSEYQ